MDVRPANIVLSFRGHGSNVETRVEDMHVQLVDWGAAANIGVSLRHFRGCIPYAHDLLLTRDIGKMWKPMPFHDHASLAYTLTTIKVRMQSRTSCVPWQGFFRDHGVDQDALTVRQQFTEEMIKGHADPDQAKLLTCGILAENSF